MIDSEDASPIWPEMVAGNYACTYDKVGNITKITDVANATRTQTLTYG